MVDLDLNQTDHHGMQLVANDAPCIATANHPNPSSLEVIGHWVTEDHGCDGEPSTDEIEIGHV